MKNSRGFVWLKGWQDIDKTSTYKLALGNNSNKISFYVSHQFFCLITIIIISIARVFTLPCLPYVQAKFITNMCQFIWMAFIISKQYNSYNINRLLLYS